jgi:hypothetical protein
MTGQLAAPQGQERDETTDVEAVGRGIEAHVDRPGRLGQMSVELRGRADVRDEPALLEVLEH